MVANGKAAGAKQTSEGAYAGTPVNRQVQHTQSSDQGTIRSEIKTFIGSYLANCSDGSTTYLDRYVYSGDKGPCSLV
jgi:hypothetical protein